MISQGHIGVQQERPPNDRGHQQSERSNADPKTDNERSHARAGTGRKDLYSGLAAWEDAV